MGNILGLSSAEYIVKQVDLRQEKLGILDNIPDDILTWSHGKTAWVRLASSVDIEGSSNQAKDNILFGTTAVWSPAGTNDVGEQVPENWLLTAGFNESYPRISSYVSGSFGYRPRPGITNVDVTYLNNNGTLKKAKIKLKVYSPEQLEIIDKLYMRLGYHVLLEWGHTLYLNNDTKNVESFNLFTTGPFNEFFANKTTPTKILNSIKEEQKKYFGNYEAFYGKIVKFNWKFNEDATYDVDLEVISQGDIIESLLVNSMATIIGDSKSETTTQPSGSVSVVSLKNASAFNRFLYDIYNAPFTSLSPKPQGLSTLDFLISSFLTATGNVGAAIAYTSTQIGNTITPSTVDLTNIKSTYNNMRWKGNEGLLLPFIEKDTFLWFDTNNRKIYIPLGFLLSYLESNQNLFNADEPHLFFDVEDDNYCLTFDGSATNNGPYHVSSDPTICIIPSAFTKYDVSDFNKFNVEGNKNIGRVMYIHYNIDYLAKLLFNIRDEKGKVFLSKFLDTILADTNRCLGGINNLTYKIKDDNTIYIVEEAPLNYGSLKPESIPANFNVFGVRSNQGSFIKNIDFNVTITNDMATTITIGAQANGNQISQNATALSNFNIGLIDRTEELRSPETKPSDKAESRKKAEDIAKKFADAANTLYSSEQIDINNIENLINANSDFAKLIIGNQALAKEIPAPSFLPFELNLTMVGLSGMKIFEKFTLTSESEKILPSTYRDNNGKSIVDFLITDLSHKISNNTWETNIKGRTIPAEILQSQSVFLPSSLSSPITTPNSIPSSSTFPSDICPKISGDKEKALLNFISKYEGRTYNTIVGGGKISDLTTLTLNSVVEDLQPKMIKASNSNKKLIWKNNTYKDVISSAVGRYQFIKDTLQDTIKISNYEPNTTQFLPNVQDELILIRLRTSRGLTQFLSGNLSVQEFSLNLAKEFASLPVLYSTRGKSITVNRGQSFYAGDGKNKALHSADDFQRFLEQLNPSAPLGNKLTSLCKK